MNDLISLRSTCDDGFTVEFEVLPSSEKSSSEQQKIQQSIEEVEEELEKGQFEIDKLDSEIGRLTNTADSLDYTIAAASGLLTGMLDAFWVGEFSLDRANEKGEEVAKETVIKAAKKIIDKEKIDPDKKQKILKNLTFESAVKYLEEKFPIAADKATGAFGGGSQHHLRDFSHHPTVIGLLFSLLTQVTGCAYGTDTAGCFISVPVGPEYIGKNPQQKLAFAIIHWFYHLISDMAGSTTTIRKGGLGTGLPGPLVSLAKELSTLPIFRKTNKKGYKEFSVWISKLFNGTLLAKRNSDGTIAETVKFDWRTEIGVKYELRKQALPVLLNEVAVRVFYFFRRLYQELRQQKVASFSDLKRIDAKKVLPFRNRTIIRMLTVSSGTFTAVDMADAVVRSAIKSGGFYSPEFIPNMLLRVNFIGIGRFTISIGVDAFMGFKKERARNERILLYTRQIELSNAKFYYKEANMWLSAKDAVTSIEKAYSLMEETTAYYIESISEISNDLKKLSSYRTGIEAKNKNLLGEINDILYWG